MHITLHTERGPLTLAAPCTLAQALPQLLRGLDRSPETVATAVNGGLCRAAQREALELRDGDRSFCSHPSQAVDP